MARGLKPDRRVCHVREVTAEYLGQMGIRGVITDLDNTLALPDDPIPTPEGRAWLGAMKSAGIPVVVVSNNSSERVRRFCEPLALPFVANCAKPLGGGIRRAVGMLGLPREQVALIGDQLFTDVWAASRSGIACILTQPLVLESGTLFRMKRRIEAAIDKNRR